MFLPIVTFIFGWMLRREVAALAAVTTWHIVYLFIQ